tara:strand:+ start:1833 stop:1946 length:114 start_codon:yes stop_codon:yes gene_type:complete
LIRKKTYIPAEKKVDLDKLNAKVGKLERERDLKKKVE